MSKHAIGATAARRRGAAGALVLAIALLHGWLADAWLQRSGAVPTARPGGPVSMRVRAEAAPARLPTTVSAPTTPAPAPSAARPAARHGRLASALHPAPAALPRAKPPPPAPRSAVPYSTRPPPSQTLHYRVTQGTEQGRGTLTWALADTHYEAALTVMLDGEMPLFDWRSSGTIDADGVAPVLHTEQRRKRSPRAIQFERDRRQLSFSETASTPALAPGGQDRLSWIAQLAAIARADTAQLAPGRLLTLQVALAAGNADLWTFQVVERGTEGIHLHRAAQRPYESEIDVWLDPGHGHWPRRLVQAYPPAALKLELILAD